jgi:hypothetical protein
MMTDYTMQFVTDGGQVADHLESCAGDVGAMKKARELAALKNSVVDVWQADRRVAMVSLELKPLAFSDPAALQTR